MPLSFVFHLADLFNALMAIPNLIALFLLRKIIITETSNFLENRNMFPSSHKKE